MRLIGIHIILFCALAGLSFGQVTIFSENMGSPAANTAIASWTGWQNNGILTFTGTGDVRNTTASSGYPTASGTGNVFIINTVGTYYEISGINTTYYSGITLKLGHYKSTTASNNELVIETSPDGATYTPLTYSRATGTGTASWLLITPTGTIPSTANLRIRFRQTSISPQFRIDDVVLTGNCITPVTQASNLTFSAIFGTTMTVSWTNGSGAYRVVKINTVNSFTAPANGTSPISNSVYGGTGEQVVYNGNSNSVTVTGLIPGATYWFEVFEYNCTGINTFYNTATATNNPLSQATCNCSSPGDYYRSLFTGNWTTAGNWESSYDNITWITATLVPTSAAAAVTVRNPDVITIDANASAPTLTINYGGTLQANSTSFVTLTLTGDLVNDGIFQMYDPSTKAVDVVFTKNGNQNISGTGVTTNFYSIGLNMGTSRSNILDISASNFSCLPSRALLFNSSNANVLTNGTIKFSGSYTFSGPIFKTGLSYAIANKAGVWLNNPNVNITSSNDSYDVSGLLKVTSGTLNVGIVIGNSIRLLAGGQMVVQGGTVNVSGRIQANNSGGTAQGTLSYNQSGGVVTLTTAGSNTHASISDFHFVITTDTLIMSGGTLVFRNVATTASDLKHLGYSLITGGTMQFADASSASAIDFEIETGATSYLPSLVLNNAAGLGTSLYPGTDISVKGSITINSGTTLDNDWGSGFYYNFSLTGNWNNDGTFLHHNQKYVQFNGSSAQFITGTTTTLFNQLILANAWGLTLSSPATINGTSGVLTLSSGKLYTSSTNILAMMAGTSVAGASNSNFVYGPMSKTGSTDFIFPVGKDLQYRPISVTSLTGSETFTAEYFHADPDAVPYDVTLMDPTLDHIGRCEYWILNRAGSVNANVTLSWNTYSCGVSSLPDLAVARWDGAMWKDHGNGGTTGFPATSGTVISSAAVTSFSPFTLASRVTAGAVNPLPVELISFTASFNSSNTVDVKWTTASETNNDYFTVERSADGMRFDKINQTDGAGNSSSVLNYSTTDYTPLSGVSYYRLRQTDFDGNEEFSQIVSVEKNATDFEIINTVHETTQGQLTVYFNCGSDCNIALELYDISGKKVFSSPKNVLENNSGIVIPTSSLAGGIYLIKASNGSSLVFRKVKL